MVVLVVLVLAVAVLLHVLVLILVVVLFRCLARPPRAPTVLLPLLQAAVTYLQLHGACPTHSVWPPGKQRPLHCTC
jgi:hypothetical protein